MTALQLNAELYRAMGENRETEVIAASVSSCLGFVDRFTMQPLSSVRS